MINQLADIQLERILAHIWPPLIGAVSKYFVFETLHDRRVKVGAMFHMGTTVITAKSRLIKGDITWRERKRAHRNGRVSQKSHLLCCLRGV